MQMTRLSLLLVINAIKLYIMNKLLTILLFFYITKANAQAQYPVGSYNANPELIKFEGTWKWASGNDSLIIFLQKQPIHFPAPLEYDVEHIIGCHKYYKNGLLVESSYQFAGLPYYGGHSTVFVWSQSLVKLYGNFRDKSKNKRCDVYLTMVNTQHTQMSLKFTEPRGITPVGFIYGFTMPNNIVLTKQ